jgi:16S rRNA (adenine1518-N6/adenine1519-N6)-dimethyltransferase
LAGSRSGSTSTSSRNRSRLPVRAKKRFGQHFLSDINILTRIVDAAEIAPGETVLEVGPGLGALTAVLAERARRVVAVEVDQDLIAGLRSRFADAPNVAIVEGDVLERSPGELLFNTETERSQRREEGFTAKPQREAQSEQGRERDAYVVVANLPYNIAAPVLRRFLEGDVRPRRLVVMVQLEVAEAIVAKPGRMSLLSVATQVYGDARMVMKVAPGAFSPPPKVESAVVRIDVAAVPKVDVPIDAFFRIVRAGFGNPRKQLRNSLSFGLHVKQEIIDGLMMAAGVDPTRRPQVLSLDDWASITRAWDAFTAEAQRTQRDEAGSTTEDTENTEADTEAGDEDTSPRPSPPGGEGARA